MGIFLTIPSYFKNEISTIREQMVPLGSNGFKRYEKQRGNKTTNILDNMNFRTEFIPSSVKSEL